MIYVLIIMTNVYGGIHVAMQEFNTKAACESAAKVVETKLGERWLWSSVTCVNKQKADE